MKKLIFFASLILGIFVSFSFNEKINKKSAAFLPIKNLDSTIRVGVIFDDIPQSTAYCGIKLVKVTYKFKLVNISKFKVRSKDSMIRIQFTCPKEIGVLFLLNKTYYFNIVPLYDTKEDLRSVNDGMPLYSFTGF